MIPLTEKVQLEEYIRLVDDLTLLSRGYVGSTDEHHHRAAHDRIKSHADKVYARREIQKLQERLARMNNEGS